MKTNKINLDAMLKPKSVAIIGASREPNKVGHVILQNYLNAGYSGKLYAINKNATSNILGVRTYQSILKIKEAIDLAVIAVPAQAVPSVLEECGKAKVKSAIVITSGFAEIGNVELQDKIVEIANKYNIAVLGPNCLGVVEPRSRIDTLFLPTYKLSHYKVGNVSFISQSGAIGSTILDIISDEGFGLSKFISYGNAAVLDEVDLLHYLMNDQETRVVVAYLEGIKRGKEFVKVAKEIGMKKPVIVIKAGRTSAGSEAAHSHTASIAGNYEVEESIFKQSGFIVAHDISELLDYAKIFDTSPEPKGNKVFIVTNGGGAGVLTTDAIASTKNLSMAQLSKNTQEKLREVMPDIVNIRNPLDVGGDADYKRYDDALQILAKENSIDIYIIIVLFQTPGADSKVVESIIKFKEQVDKPVIGITIGSEFTQAHKKMMESAGIPVYESPKAAAMSISALVWYYNYKKERMNLIKS